MKLKKIAAVVSAAAVMLALAGCKSEEQKALEALEAMDKNSINTGNNPASAVSKPDPKPLDPFKGLEVNFEGNSPVVNASLKGQKSNVKYTLDRDRGLKNGDKITVTAELSTSDKEKFVLTSDSKEFTVSNRPAYIMKLSDLTNDDIQKLGAKVVELSETTVANHFAGGEGSTVNSFEFLGNILYTNDRNKYLFFVYKANTTFANYGQTLDYYFVGYYQYIYKEADGTFGYYDNKVSYNDLGDMSMSLNGHYYGGYTTIDGVYDYASRLAGSGCERESNVKE